MNRRRLVLGAGVALALALGATAVMLASPPPGGETAATAARAPRKKAERLVIPNRPAAPAPELPDAEPADADALAEVARTLDATADVRCAVVPPLERATLRAMDAPLGGEIVLGHAYLRVFAPEGTAWVAIDGYEPVQVSWTLPADGGPGRCAPEPLRLVAGNPAAVTGVVRSAEGEPEGRVWVEGCGARTLTDVDGGYFLSVIPEPCSVRAYRQDGVFTGLGDAVAVTPKPGVDTVVNLTLPPHRTAGLGMRVAPADGGIRLLGAIDGGAAAEAGLDAGDLVVAIDGEPTDGMDLEDFVGRATGREGTSVVIDVVGPDGEREQLRLDRRVIEASD